MKILPVCLLATLFWFSDRAHAGGDEVLLNGVIRDTSGAEVGDILIHARAEEGELEVSTRTAEDGSFVIEVPYSDRVWKVAIDERELLERGYFCFPDFIWEPEDPVELPELTTVPLQPSVTLVRSEDEVTCVRLDFDWLAGLSPSILRQFRIERSLDLKSWEEVITVALGCPPMSIFDETQTGMVCGYYRVVPVESLRVLDLEEWERVLIADPNMGWEGDPVLVFDAGEPLPEIPVMAPDIFIRPSEAGAGE